MRRTYDRERYLRLVAKLRDAIPGLALGTDVIVGFPGETEDDFRETLEVVEEVRYDSAFTFIYSPRQGTEAAAMPDQVPDEVKHERLERLVDVVQRLASERNAERVGTIEEVLVEGWSRTDASLLRGRTRRNTTVNFTGDAAARRAGRRRDRRRHLDHAARCPAHGGRGMKILVTGLVGADRHEPRAPAAAGRPRGLRRRQAPEHVDGRASGTCSRTSPATTPPSRAGSTASSTRRRTSSSIWPPTRRCTSSSGSRTGRSRTP